MRTPRRTALTTAAAGTTALLLLPLITACDAVNRALDCGQLAIEITSDVQQLENALNNAANSPQDAENALDTLAADLKKFGDKTDNADLGKAVGDLTDQVNEAQDALDAGRVPSAKPFASSAAEISKVCAGS